MSDLREYKCPACGGAMEFDSGSQKMKCPFCDTEVSIEEFEQEQKKNPEETRWEAGNGAQWKEDEISGMAVYSCQSCGGEITADKTTGATTCPFCGNRVVLKGQFEGELRPDYIIPFKLDKKAAKAAYYKHLEKKSFLPKVFSFENHIDEIVGVYVPFWLFDVDAQAYIMQSGYEPGDREIKNIRSMNIIMWTEPAALNLNMFQQIVQEKWTMHLWKQSNHMILKMLCHFRHRILPDMWQTDMM